MPGCLPTGRARTCAWLLLGILIGLAPLAPGQSQPVVVKDWVRYDASTLGFLGTGNSNKNDNFGQAAAFLGDLDGPGGSVAAIAFGHTRDDDVDDPAKLGAGKYLDNGALWIVFLNADGSVADQKKISAATLGTPPLDTDLGPPGVDGQDLAGVRGFGQAIDAIGDLDGDGVVDLVVGVYEDDDGTTNAGCTNCSNPNLPIDVGFGSVFVLFMNTDGSVKAYQKISQTQGALGPALGIKEYFGSAVASMGDFNDDGLLDILVGAPGTHKFNPTTQLAFPSPLDASNGDPQQEHVSATGLGRVWIISLNPDGTVAKRVPVDMPMVDLNPANPQDFVGVEDGLDGSTSNEYGDEFGRAVAYLGDFDGDTLDPDDPSDVDSLVTIAVGAPMDDDGPLNPQGRYGAVWILGLDLVGPQGIPTVVESQKISASFGNFQADLNARDHFGISVDAAGDWDKDGIQDLVVGAFFDDDGQSNSGAVYILLLNRNGTVKSHFKISNTLHGLLDPLSWNGSGANFGSSVANIGDFDGNGTNDFIAGAELYDPLHRGAGWLITTDFPRLALGDRVDGLVDPDDGYTFTFEATKGTRVSMTAVQRLSGMEPALRILGPLIPGEVPAVLADVEDTTTKKTSPKARRKAKLPKKFTVPATGEYLVQVLDVGGVGGAFRMKTKGKPAKDVRKVVQVVEIGKSGEMQDVAFDAASGSLLKKLSIKALKPKGDFAVVGSVAAALKPMLDALLTPEDAPLAIEDMLSVNPAGTKVSLQMLPLGSLGTYTVQVHGAAQSVGYAVLKAAIKIPRSKEKIELP